MVELHEVMIFGVKFPNETIREYSLAEYLYWRTEIGVPVHESEITDLITWMQAKDNNLGRLGCYLSVLEFRKRYPEHPAVIAFKNRQR